MVVEVLDVLRTGGGVILDGVVLLVVVLLVVILLVILLVVNAVKYKDQTGSFFYEIRRKRQSGKVLLA